MFSKVNKKIFSLHDYTFNGYFVQRNRHKHVYNMSKYLLSTIGEWYSINAPELAENYNSTQSSLRVMFQLTSLEKTNSSYTEAVYSVLQSSETHFYSKYGVDYNFLRTNGFLHSFSNFSVTGFFMRYVVRSNYKTNLLVGTGINSTGSSDFSDYT